MPQEEDGEALATDLHGGEKQRVREIEIQIQSQSFTGRDTRSGEDKSRVRVRVRVSGVPTQPEPGAGDDEGHLEERDRLETMANGGGGTDGNTITNSHSSPRAREERGRREESGDRVR